MSRLALLFLLALSVLPSGNAGASILECKELLGVVVDFDLVTADEVSMEDIKGLGSADGSLTVFTKSPMRNMPTGYLLKVMSVVTKSTGKAMMDYAAFEPLGDLLARHPNIAKKAKAGDWNAKRAISQTLKTLNLFLKQAKPELAHLNLLELKSWFELFEVNNLNELHTLITSDAWIDRVNNAGNNSAEEAGDNDRRKIIEFLQKVDSPMLQAAFNPGGFVQSLRLEPLADDLTKYLYYLHLPKERAIYYFTRLKWAYSNVMASGLPPAEDKALKAARGIMSFSEAAFEVFPELRPEQPHRIMTAGFFNLLARKAIDYHHFYEISEHRLEENLAAATALNEKIELITEEVEFALRIRQKLGADHQLDDKISGILDKAQSLKIMDLELESEAEANWNHVHNLHFELNQIIESILADHQKQSIVDFRELNFRWSRVLEDHAYKIEGLDFDEVIFGKETLDFFVRDTERLGDRFLSALEKGYVRQKGETGIRKAPDIHRDFRYLKVKKSHGKVRILGKIVGRKLYLFSIFNKDENFDQDKIRHLMNHFNP